MTFMLYTPSPTSSFSLSGFSMSRLMLSVMAETPDFDVELWYIYRIKNGELIRAFLPEEMIDATIEGIRKSILVETKTSITLDYDTEKEE